MSFEQDSPAHRTPTVRRDDCRECNVRMPRSCEGSSKTKRAGFRACGGVGWASAGMNSPLLSINQAKKGLPTHERREAGYCVVGFYTHAIIDIPVYAMLP